jgi:hypothetical protein
MKSMDRLETAQLEGANDSMSSVFSFLRKTPAVHHLTPAFVALASKWIRKLCSPPDGRGQPGRAVHPREGRIAITCHLNDDSMRGVINICGLISLMGSLIRISVSQQAQLFMTLCIARYGRLYLALWL